MVAQLARGVQRVVLHHHGPQPQDSVESHHMLRAVGQDQGHPVPGTHPELAQPFGRLLHLFAELRIAGAPPKEFCSRALACFSHRAFEHAAERFGRQVNTCRDAGLVIGHPGGRSAVLHSSHHALRAGSKAILLGAKDMPPAKGSKIVRCTN
ncbi:hypothetical protein D3C74_391620 [compost metagenome]